MIEEIREAIKTQNELIQQYAIRFANTEDREEKIKFDRHTYCRDILISLLPK